MEGSLFAVRGLGLKTSTTSSIGDRRCMFTPTSCIGDPWICEGFRGFKDRFDLDVVVERLVGISGGLL